MTLSQLLPVAREIPADEIDTFAVGLAAPCELAPFDPAVLEFCRHLGRELRAVAGQAPELAALGFWLRPAALARLREDVLGTGDPVRLVPRGTVFAIPPANVDTVFAYTWLLALLLGNRTVIRVPGRSGPLLQTLLDCVRRAMAALPDSSAADRVRAASVVVAYGHDDAITTALSASCHLRVVWGGDETVTRLRRLPLPPASRDLSFGDRSALCLLDTDAVAALDPTGLRDLARAFVGDAYPFDQRACSSPRAVLWRDGSGAGGGSSIEAQERFWAAVRAELDQRDAPDVSAGLDALTVAWEHAAAEPGVRVTFSGTDLTRVSGVALDGDRHGWRARHSGGGLFAEVRVADLRAATDLVVAWDQTVTTFGFTSEELTEIAGLFGGRGVDRVVPVGAALTFSRWWDGVDLVAELTRRVHVPGAVPPRPTTPAPAPRAAEPDAPVAPAAPVA
jgi:hypothetical protein